AHCGAVLPADLPREHRHHAGLEIVRAQHALRGDRLLLRNLLPAARQRQRAGGETDPRDAPQAPRYGPHDVSVFAIQELIVVYSGEVVGSTGVAPGCGGVSAIASDGRIRSRLLAGTAMFVTIVAVTPKSAGVFPVRTKRFATKVGFAGPLLEPLVPPTP